MQKWYIVARALPHSDETILIVIQGYELPIVARFYGGGIGGALSV